MRTVSEQEFRERANEVLSPLMGQYKSVMGPGRSGAVASVYASHLLEIPWLPATASVPLHLRPVLVVDTAVLTGHTLKRFAGKVGAKKALAVFHEPPIVRFWYEKHKGTSA